MSATTKEEKAISQTRRGFITSATSIALVSLLPVRTLANLIGPTTPTASADSNKPAAPAQDIRFGYAAITWGGKDVQAIEEISEVGFTGIQLRSNILKDFGDKPRALADALKQHGLTFVALSGGGPSGPDYIESEVIATQAKNAAFLHDAGGIYLQIIDSARPKDRKPSSEDFKRIGRVLNEMGKRATDQGVTLVYHNHMRALGEGPAELDAVMDAADARYVKLLLDVAHYRQGGGDPVHAIRQYRDRMVFVHLKDVESPVDAATDSSKANYRFVELGRGKVDLPAVMSALKEIRYHGWIVVELDAVPDKARTPKESAIMNKQYIEEKLRMKI